MKTNRLIVKYKDHSLLQNVYSKSVYKNFSLDTGNSILIYPESNYEMKPLYSKKYAINQHLIKNNIPMNKTFEIGTTFYSDELFNSFDKYEQEKSKVFIIEAKNKKELADLYDKLKDSDLIEYVEYDTLFFQPDIIYGKTQENTEYNSEPFKRINAVDCWDAATGKGIIIAVLDTGINFRNEDLKGQLWTDELGNFGRHFFTDDNENFDITDYAGHGTIVSGIIGAEINNEKGINGLASGSKILTVKFSEDNIYSRTSKSAICRGIDYAIQKGAKIMTISWISKLPPECNISISEIIDHALDKGIIVICSANNKNGNVKDYFPPNLPQVITVGTILQENLIWGNRGDGIDIFAAADGWSSLDHKTDTVKSLIHATSWGAPQVASLIAMMLEIKSNLTKDEILKYIQENAQTIEIKGNKKYVIKLIDVLKTLEFVKKLKI